MLASGPCYKQGMVDMAKQIAYWRSGSDEDRNVAVELVSRGRIRHGLFFAHLAVEKMLKAHVCRATDELAPPIHNLVRLAARAAIELSDEQIDLLAEVNEFNIEGRYPDTRLPGPSIEEAIGYLSRIDEVLTCLKAQF